MGGSHCHQRLSNTKVTVTGHGANRGTKKLRRLLRFNFSYLGLSRSPTSPVLPISASSPPRAKQSERVKE